jgi:signal peptidase I
MAEAKTRKAKELTPRAIRRRAKEALALGRWIARRRKKRMPAELVEELGRVNESLGAALRARDPNATRTQGEHLAEMLQGKLKPFRPSELWWNIKWILIWVGIALCVRLVACELFSIPSGSMLPTLQVGDRVVVSKASYGLRVPLTFEPPKKVWAGRDVRRGEIVVFIHPQESDRRDMVKRVVAIGGDTIRFRDGRIWLKKKGDADFQPIARTSKGKHKYCDYDSRTERWSVEEADAFEERHGDATYIALRESHPGDLERALRLTRRLLVGSAREAVKATEDTFGPIPEGHAFMVGDNREHSEDSRYWGTVPYDFMKGPALIDLFSYGAQPEKSCDGDSFFSKVRWNRFFKPLD